MEWKEYIVTEEEFRDSNEMDYLYSAFTASELGEILPLFWVQKKWPDYYRSHSKLVWMNDFFMADEDTLVNSMATTLIYLIENKLI